MKLPALPLFVSSLIAVLHFSPVAHSQLVNVPGVYGTGVASPGVLIAEGAVDPHYAIISGPAIGDSYVVNSASMSPYWIPNGPTSSWVSFTPSSASTSIGVFVYRTTFDLTGYLPSTAVLSGLWNTDNNGISISLNGTTFTFTTDYESFSQPPSPFTISSGFLPGLNTLDFTLFDEGVKTGLRVDGLEVKAVVPEPSTYALLLVSGAGALWWSGRKRF